LVHRDTTQKYVAANTVGPWTATIGSSSTRWRAALHAARGHQQRHPGRVSTGGQFIDGFNGQNASSLDIIGAYDPITGAGTGLKAFEDTDNITVNVIACPMDNLQST